MNNQVICIYEHSKCTYTPSRFGDDAISIAITGVYGLLAKNK